MVVSSFLMNQIPRSTIIFGFTSACMNFTVGARCQPETRRCDQNVSIFLISVSLYTVFLSLFLRFYCILSEFGNFVNCNRLLNLYRINIFRPRITSVLGTETSSLRSLSVSRLSRPQFSSDIYHAPVPILYSNHISRRTSQKVKTDLVMVFFLLTSLHEMRPNSIFSD